MLNVDLLRARMVEKRYSQRSLARAIGMSENTLSSRMCLHTSLNTDEIDNICNVLGIIDPTDKINIFLRPSSQMRDENGLSL
ncbi:MAG: helix-turn-helix transcriptional regulator [bacterium]|nr:helix-turn-helix transcriptional regulator [bacterium]